MKAGAAASGIPMAVYTEVTDEDVAAFVAEYDLGSVRSLKVLARDRPS